MEDCGNIFEKRVTGISKTRVGKPPTRLQKHAPESLKLDQMKPSTSPSEAPAPTPIPIPLLTPLALSPSLFPDTDEFMFPIPKDKNVPTNQQLIPPSVDGVIFSIVDSGVQCNTSQNTKLDVRIDALFACTQAATFSKKQTM
ncbi:hypothetical protein GQ457_18G006040 [Hibiscus cannabinus]